MHFSTPQDRITKEMIMDYQKTEQERNYDDSAGILKKYAPSGLVDTLESPSLTSFISVTTGATEDEFNDKDAEYKYFKKQRDEANQKWTHSEILAYST
jgi:hypothetical protein